MRKFWLGLTLLSFGFGECKESISIDNPRVNNSTCSAPLSDICAMGCPSYDQKLASLREETKTTCRLTTAGTCGDYRYLDHYGQGIGQRSTYYYNSNGELVAYDYETDITPFCENSYAMHYGEKIDCTPERTETICTCDGTGMLTRQCTCGGPSYAPYPCKTDGGTTVYDLGVPPSDGGPKVDGGPRVDLGYPTYDGGGSYPYDLGYPQWDCGYHPNDLSYPPLDGGAHGYDLSYPTFDGGGYSYDLGYPTVDSGTSFPGDMSGHQCSYPARGPVYSPGECRDAPRHWCSYGNCIVWE